MYLYLVRHGIATDKQEHPERPLTDAGSRQVDEMGAFLAARWAFGRPVLWHSGKLRAQQTAVVFGRHTLPGAVPELHAGLTPNGSPDQTAREIERLDRDLMIAGHLPHLGRLAALLLTGDADRDVIAFEKAAVVCLARGDDGVWRLCWMATPAVVTGDRGSPGISA